MHLPMNPARVLEETHTDGVDGRITPSFVEETTCAVEEVEILLILLASEEFHITNLEVRPKVTGRVSIRCLRVIRALIVRQPVPHVIVREVVGMRREELLRRRPQSWYTLRSIEQVDREAVGLVVILHVPEHIIVNVAEELNLGLDSPVVAGILEGWMFVEHATVPTAHLVVG